MGRPGRGHPSVRALVRLGSAELLCVVKGVRNLKAPAGEKEGGGGERLAVGRALSSVSVCVEFK